MGPRARRGRGDRLRKPTGLSSALSEGDLPAAATPWARRSAHPLHLRDHHLFETFEIFTFFTSIYRAGAAHAHCGSEPRLTARPDLLDE